MSKVLVTYGKHVLSVGQVADVYNDKYKGIWVCLQVGVGLLLCVFVCFLLSCVCLCFSTCPLPP